MGRNRVRHHVNPLADRTEHSFAGFANANPIIMDIGSDRGEFMAQLMEIYGDTRNYILCEIRKPLAEKLRKKYDSTPNVIVFDGDAGRNFEKIIKPSVEKGIILEEVFINFPDPWFKDRHKKRRFLNQNFIRNVEQFILPHTRWYFQTDQKDLFDETRDLLEKVDDVQVTIFTSPPHGCTTKWERAKVFQGYNIYRLFFHINRHAT